MKSIPTLEDLIQKGLIVDSPDFRSEKFPDGRARLHFLHKFEKPAGGCCACGPVGLFWPDHLEPQNVDDDSDNQGGPYLKHTGNGYWRQVCLRVVRYTRNTATGALSDRQVFRVSRDFPIVDDVLTCDSWETLDPTTNWWEPTPDQITDMVSYVAARDCSGSDTGTMKVSIYVKFWRKYHRHVDSDGHFTGSPNWIADGAEEDSLPFIDSLCWKYV